MRDHLDRLPGPLRQQPGGHQPPHAAAAFLRPDGFMDGMQSDRVKAQLRGGVYARRSETYDAAESCRPSLSATPATLSSATGWSWQPSR